MKKILALTLALLAGCKSDPSKSASIDAGSADAAALGDEFDRSLASAYSTPGSFPTRFQDVPGAYVWGGVLDASITRSRPLAGSVERVTDIGFASARIALTPYMQDATDYGMTFAKAPTKLVELLDSPEIDETLRNPHLDVITLTTFDYATGFPTRNRFLEHDFLIANQRAVFDEYVTFSEALLRKYAGTGKTFVIANWEGDNTLFCGDVAKYGANDAAVHQCEATLADKDMKARVDAFTLWNAIRKAAILAARARVGTASDVTLAFAIEMNQVHIVDANTWRTTLSSVIPDVKPDLALYSAYESTGKGTIVPDLVDVRRQLDAKGLKSTRIGIGELGINGNAATQTHKVKDTLRGMVSGTTDVALVYLWNAVNPTMCDRVKPDPTASCWGLYQPDGTPYVAPYAGGLVPNVGTTTTKLSPTPGQSLLTIDGTFPGAADKAKLEVFVNCLSPAGHAFESLTVASSTATEVVAVIPQHLEGASCSLRVHSDFGIPSAWSNPFRLQ